MKAAGTASPSSVPECTPPSHCNLSAHLHPKHSPSSLRSFMVLARKDPETAKALHDLMDTDVSAALRSACCVVLCMLWLAPGAGTEVPAGAARCTMLLPSAVSQLNQHHSSYSAHFFPFRTSPCRSSCATSGWWPCPRSRWWRESRREPPAAWMVSKRWRSRAPSPP